MNTIFCCIFCKFHYLFMCFCTLLLVLNTHSKCNSKTLQTYVVWYFSWYEFTVGSHPFYTRISSFLFHLVPLVERIH
uniref:Secreted protein n=1 Tax=Rhizophora mucronata TaxID=61149 RepID=A0A2P2JUL9_RHIMU